MGFDGFSQEAPRFLLENRMNNSKEWYEEHKHVYRKYVYEPFVELVKELSPAMKEIDSSIITVPSKIISRVRRDTRFTKDKTLYRDNAWIVFCGTNRRCRYRRASGLNWASTESATELDIIKPGRLPWQR